MYKLLINFYYKIVKYHTLKLVRNSIPKTLNILINNEGLKLFGVW